MYRSNLLGSDRTVANRGVNNAIAVRTAYRTAILWVEIIKGACVPLCRPVDRGRFLYLQALHYEDKEREADDSQKANRPVRYRSVCLEASIHYLRR